VCKRRDMAGPIHCAGAAAGGLEHTYWLHWDRGRSRLESRLGGQAISMTAEEIGAARSGPARASVLQQGVGREGDRDTGLTT
jgi:hypothetical protein